MIRQMKILVFDIGGTAIKYGICEGGRLLTTSEVPTHAENGGRHVMNTVMELAKEALNAIPPTSLQAPFDAIGISTAGQVDSENGSIIYANSNIPGYTGMKIRKELEAEFHVPIMVENDVNCAAIGEAIYGAGKNSDSFLCLTYGTGVGGAIVQNKRIYHGSSFSAGEFGGIVTHGDVRFSASKNTINTLRDSTGAAGKSIETPVGNSKADAVTETDYFSGCYEHYASVTALVKKATEYDAALTNGRVIFEHLDDPQVLNILNCWIDEIILGLVTLIHIFNPPCIVLGGGIMTQPLILNTLKDKLFSQIMPNFSHVKLLTAELGNHAGLCGIYHLTSEYCKMH